MGTPSPRVVQLLLNFENEALAGRGAPRAPSVDLPFAEGLSERNLVAVGLPERLNEELYTIVSTVNDPNRLEGKTWKQINPIVARVAEAEGVPGSFLTTLLSIENIPTSNGGLITEMAGTYRGWGQFAESTWNEVMPGVPWSQCGDIHAGLIAIARYYKQNRTQFLKKYPQAAFTDDIGILCHNQGAGGALHFVKNGYLLYPKQSTKLLQVAARVRGSRNALQNSFIA